MKGRLGFLVPIVVTLTCACSTTPQSTSTTAVGPDATFGGGSATVPMSGDPLFVADVEDAVAMSIATAPEGRPVVAWITHDSVVVAEVEPTTGELVDQRAVNGEFEPINHPIERPAVGVRPDGTIDVAFTSFQGDGATVFWSRDGAEPLAISGAPRPETNLVHMTMGPDGEPILSWLEDSTLSVAATGEGQTPAELELVDDLTCDCCNPVPLFVDDSLIVTYRDRDTIDGEIVRDAAVVRSTDGGQTFGEPVQIADDHWFIDGCPFTGPASATVEGSLVVAWMDARQSVHPDQADSSIWIDRSSDGGTSFGSDLEVIGEGIHRWPAIVADASDRIHLIWETDGPDGGLSYSWSDDGGVSFSDPSLLVDREMSHGLAPRAPSAVVNGSHVVVSWADSTGGHVAAWEVGG